MIHDNNSNSVGKFVLSYELLNLLQWLVEHEAETLKKMIDRAVKNGFKAQTDSKNGLIELQIDENIQQSMVEFLGLMDVLLMDAHNDHSTKRILERNTIPALDHIDTTICAEEIVTSSVEKMKMALLNDASENPQEVLFKELLKRWKPAKKAALN
jgi:hypothetical protein